MSYSSLESALLDLEKHGQLLRVREEVDPHLEMAAIHLRVQAAGGPALLFERVKGSPYRAASNIFGTLERSKFLFRDSWEQIQKLISLRSDPLRALKDPSELAKSAGLLTHAWPWKKNGLGNLRELPLSMVPHITHWPEDGGAFITLPQVYTEDLAKPGVKHSNLGMYRIQLSGNDYQEGEIGLHYQLHRGIGIHQSIADQLRQPLKVSIFVGGPPAHALAAVMPLPEAMSELTFAGLLGRRRFRYSYVDGYCISLDADFVITGEVRQGMLKPEGPFGDHLGYYSLRHDFPVLKVHKVYAKPNAIWPFTVVGRPPQEDTAFGEMIHLLTGDAIRQEIPGVREIHAVDAAGVHPLLLAVGSERYTPFLKTNRPAELLTQANRILGTGQLSLAKFLLIVDDPEKRISASDIPAFLRHLLERFDPSRDLHFITKTSVDTLDYSGTALNEGSKLIIATCGDKKRGLGTTPPQSLQEAVLPLPGILCLRSEAFLANEHLAQDLTGFPWIVLCDDPAPMKDLRNFLWVLFTRVNPSHDVHGIGESITNKHWGCTGPVIFDARIKPHHAPQLKTNPEVEARIERIFAPGGSLECLEKKAGKK